MEFQMLSAKKVTSVATFVTPLEDVDVPEGDNLTLKCKVSGEPTPTLKWLILLNSIRLCVVDVQVFKHNYKKNKNLKLMR